MVSPASYLDLYDYCFQFPIHAGEKNYAASGSSA
jgi:hypothetical protein